MTTEDTVVTEQIRTEAMQLICEAYEFAQTAPFCKGDFRKKRKDGQYAYCAVGYLIQAAANKNNVSFEVRHPTWPTGYKPVAYARRILGQFIPENFKSSHISLDTGSLDITSYNDAPGIQKRQILALLKRACASFKEG